MHGVEVADPFRWLEDGDSDETRAWVEAQNRRTTATLEELPGRRDLHQRLKLLLQAGSSFACEVAGERVFSLERWGRHDQTVLVVRPASTVGEPRTIVDPHLASGDDTTAIDWYQPSPDGRLVAFGLSTSGDERSTLHLLDVDTGEILRDRIPNTRACSIAWLSDGSAFAYTRYPDPETVPEDERGYWRKVYWHRVGGDWAADPLIWGDLPDKTAWPNISISLDDRWILVHQSLGWSRVDVYLIDRTTGARTSMIEGVDAISSFTLVGDQLIGLTTLGADRGRVVSTSVENANHANWQTIVPERDRVLEALVTTSDSLLVLSARAAVSHLDRYDLKGEQHAEIELPELGSLAGISGSPDRDEAFFSFTSFTRPPAMFRWTPNAVDEWSDLRSLEGDDVGPTGDYLVEQVRYPSSDGTEISMFIIRCDSTVPTIDTTCVLTGYGGFSITMAPAYSAGIVSVCDDGGIYAVANIRGGAEEGEAWHRAGMREHKQKSFDDFIAAADWLVDNRYTSRERLAIRGGSNGGLLMGASITQRPGLCRAVQIAVPLCDMLRYHRFLIARLWIPEYGDPEVADEFAWLYAYSPLHRVTDGTCYPSVIITTAEGDSRVDPCHARKMAAQMQEATSCGDKHPIFLREETRAGHGQGKPASKQADELTDVLSFIHWQLA